jgi:hypothetical protein
MQRRGTGTGFAGAKLSEILPAARAARSVRMTDWYASSGADEDQGRKPCEVLQMKNRFNVQVTWDGEAAMWVADSDDIPGLAAEAPDDKALWHKLEGLIPELLSMNEVRIDPSREIEVVLNFNPRKERIQLTDAT